jgi:nucleoside-diphosphate-sugar epimerase
MTPQMNAEPHGFWARAFVWVSVHLWALFVFIAWLTGLAGDIVWHTSEPDGQPRRRRDISKAERLFGFVAKKPLKEGLRRTIEWHQAHRTARACEF